MGKSALFDSFEPFMLCLSFFKGGFTFYTFTRFYSKGELQSKNAYKDLMIQLQIFTTSYYLQTKLLL